MAEWYFVSFTADYLESDMFSQVNPVWQEVTVGRKKMSKYGVW